ncbi:hypothetical protein MYAER_2476 [Microcystis aeruginosa NIES-2549]|uniref:Uncharacterized protein n=1 Tax=Microcystis aeruginosa NIES-2549 TaxID=1641812 RepID=A0A0F6RLM9_MICAE|nr:hypothetical protein MYAER_2476 [Microcystis aeruginosa NIES-2549]AOC53217.1 hypothetical protein amyaer_2506 [Microcystis aeruginosa NIES-2481]
MAIITSNIEKPDSDDDSFDCIPFSFDFTFYPPFFPKTTGFFSSQLQSNKIIGYF